jgi:hypothetical protein
MSDQLRPSKLAPWITAAALLLPLAAPAQTLDFPRPSPNASVSQTVGITQIEITYSRPGVKGRQIWGTLVPYGEVWRTGANENTTIRVSTPFKIGGKELPAGTYGLQTIPTQTAWTVILSKDADLWGAFNYKQEDDAVRFQATPQAAEPQERLSFSFEDVTDTSATVALQWEKLKLPFQIEVETPKLVVDKAKAALRWQSTYQAANYCLQNNTCLDEAGRWIDSSIATQETFANLRTKAQLLAKKNDFKGAASWGDKALAAAKGATPAPQPEQVKELEGWVAGWKKK